MTRGLVWMLFPFTIVSTPTLLAQTTEETIRDENFLESVRANKVSESDINSKLDLNDATLDELLAIPSMTQHVARSIIGYRERAGEIRNLAELAFIDGFTPEIEKGLAQHTVIIPHDTIHAAFSTYTGISPERYKLYSESCGEPGIRNFEKLKVILDDIEVHVVTDKDPGEINYLDFCSLSLEMKNQPVFSTLILGDYCISLGNGMLLSDLGVASKTSGPVRPLFDRSSFRLNAYDSRCESGFLRGGAVTFPVGSIEAAAFISSKNLSAKYDTGGSVTSIDYSGLDLPAVSSSNALLSEKIEGGIVRLASEWGTCGLAGLYCDYGRPFIGRKRNGSALDAFLRCGSGAGKIAGEIVDDGSLSYTANVGYMSGDVTFGLGLRNLASRLPLNYSGVLSETYPTSSEKGTYMGATFKPAGVFSIGFYYDRFTIVSSDHKPDRDGEEIFAESYLTLTRLGIFERRETALYLRYRYKTKEDYYVQDSYAPVGEGLLAGSKQSVRIELQHKFSNTLTSKFRYEKIFLSSGETGNAFLVDTRWKNRIIMFDASVCFYSTATYSSAVYMTERDLPGVSQFLILYGDGARISLLSFVNIVKSLGAGVKISRDLFGTGRQISVGNFSGKFVSTTYLGLEATYNVN